MAAQNLSSAEHDFLLGETNPTAVGPEGRDKLSKKSTAKNTENKSVKKTRKAIQASAADLFADIGQSDKLERFTLDLEPELAEQFKRVAKARKITRAKMLRAILKKALDAME